MACQKRQSNQILFPDSRPPRALLRPPGDAFCTAVMLNALRHGLPGARGIMGRRAFHYAELYAVLHASTVFLIPRRVTWALCVSPPARASTVSSENNVRYAELPGNTLSFNPPSSSPRRSPATSV